MTLLVQQLKKNVFTKIVQQSANYQSVYSHFFGMNDVTDFPKVFRIISPLNCHLRFSIIVLETFKFKKKGLPMQSVP